MDKFYIDRQFGQAIFIDVENGIVVDCYNESEKYINRMNELYKGKSISFLKTDFENRMKPIYHNVRPLCLYEVHQKINSVDSRLSICSNLIGSLTTSEERKKELELELNALLTEKSKFKKELETEKQRLISEHNYNF